MRHLHTAHESPRQTAMSDSMKVFVLVGSICVGAALFIGGVAGYAIGQALN